MKCLNQDRDGRSLLLPFAFLAILLSAHGADAVKVEACNKNPSDENFSAAEKLLKRAEETGIKLLRGEVDFDAAKHLNPFVLDNTVYNVVYERYYKDAKGNERIQQHALFSERLRILKIDHGIERDGARMNYAFAGAEKEKNIVIASKQILPPAGDTVNLSAIIHVMVFAVCADDRFDKARNLRTPAPVKENGK